MRVSAFNISLLALLPLATFAQSTEREALIVFFNSLGGPSWTSKQGWEDSITNTKSSICDWFGVICEGEEAELAAVKGDRTLMRRHLSDQSSQPADSPATAAPAPVTPSVPTAPVPVPVTPNAPTAHMFRRVIGINLPNNNLNGMLPNSLWRLPKLQYLVVSYNNIDVDFQSGSTTLLEIKMHETVTTSLSGIGAFTSLQSIHMSGSKLGNVVLPLELFGLTNLNYLFMAQCQLEGSIPSEVSKLTGLTELNFFDNNLGGPLPAGLNALTKLQVLTLSHNKLEGTLPSSLGTLSNLQELYLDDNLFNGTLLPFTQSAMLHNLFLNSNQFTGTIPGTFLQAAANIPSSDQWQVNLDDNNLSGLIPASLQRLQDVNLTISMSNNAFTGFENGTVLCNNVKWNDGQVSTIGCDAIACEKGFTNPMGRATVGSPCVTCATSIFFGLTTCLDGSVEGNDKAVLISLYKETGGDHWVNNDNWLKTLDHCEWYGVTCWNLGNELDGRVRWLKLDNNGLIGKIPPTIYSLAEITTISLSRNKIILGFEGIESTPRMHEINVAHTDTTNFEGIENAKDFFQILVVDQLLIEGTLPKEIYKVSSLMTLSMSECEISGALSEDLIQLSNLQELYLWGNNLKGQIPSSIGNLTALSILSLASNRFSGTLPQEIEGLAELVGFTIKDQVTKGGGITGYLRPFSKSPKLTNLILGGNRFGGKIPTTLLQMVDFNSYIIVDLSSNILTGIVPGDLGHFGRMNLLLEDNLLSSIDSHLCGRDDWMDGSVREFGCDAILCPLFTSNAWGRKVYENKNCNDCTDPGSRHVLGQTVCGATDTVFTEHNVLETLYNDCGGRDWTDNKHWNNNDVNICDWYGISCDDADSVVSIVLGDNGMKGTLPSSIYTLPNLVQLSVFDNPDLTINFDGIETAVNLQGLVLHNTSLTTLTGVGKVRSLTTLQVSYNKLTGTLPDEVSRLVNLVQLELSSNEFTGTLPSWLSKMTGLQSFMVDDNHFTGQLVDFAGLEHINLVNISSNLIDGTVPETFLINAGRDDKIFVDISSNRLTGTLPNGLQRLNRLGIKADQNMISGIDPFLCTLTAWNDYDVKEYGCDAILCATGTYNTYGRQISADSRCEPCADGAKYYGAVQCSSAKRLLTGLGLLTISCIGSMFL